MDDEVAKLQERLTNVERVAEDVLVAKHKMVELDRCRNGNREALTALRKMARKASANRGAAIGGKPKLIEELPDSEEAARRHVAAAAPGCATCGAAFDRATPVWVAVPGAGMFLRSPFHEAHCQIEKEQEAVEAEIDRLQALMKEKSLVLSEEGALSDSVGPSLMKALVTLKG